MIILDPDPQRAIVITPPNQLRVLERADMLDLDSVLPAFFCTVAEFFE